MFEIYLGSRGVLDEGRTPLEKFLAFLTPHGAPCLQIGDSNVNGHL